MITQSNNTFQTSTDIVERLLEEEREAMETIRSKATRVHDPRLQSVLRKLIEMRARNYAELELHISEIKSEAEITGQINAMFW
ncbi:MAG: hypothetical protein HY089_02555 [Ignavibacteriales bacterium]|nr:hypothetical protein [Ignavibacteriales bacterium]